MKERFYYLVVAVLAGARVALGFSLGFSASPRIVLPWTKQTVSSIPRRSLLLLLLEKSHHHQDEQQHRSLAEVLHELDQREIHYSPSATRQELQALLDRYLLEDDDATKQRMDDSSLNDLSMSSSSYLDNLKPGITMAAPPARPASPVEQFVTVYSTVCASDGPRGSYATTKPGVKHVPSSSSSGYLGNLNEFVTMEPTSAAVPPSPPMQSAVTSAATFAGEKSSSLKELDESLAEVLFELDQREIRYPPSATRQELQALLDRYVLEDDEDATKQRMDDSSLNDSSLQALLKELDESNIRYPPTASRTDLERILRQSRRSQRRQTTQTPGLFGRVLRKGQKTLFPVSNLTSVVVDKATRTARRASRKVADFVTVDEETGVRDAEYQYLFRTEITTPTGNTIDVTVVPLDRKVDDVARDTMFPRTRQDNDDVARDTTFPRTRRAPPDAARDTTFPRTRRAPPDAARDTTFPRTRRAPDDVARDTTFPRTRRAPDDVARDTTFPRTRRAPAQRSRRTRGRRPVSRSDEQRLLPAADDGDSQEKEGRVHNQKRTTSNRKSRRIYSPYEEASFDNRDVFDRLGELFVDTADQILWGSFDDNDQGNSNETVSSSAAAGSSKQKKGRRRHWKDRMEERLDYMMGIHNDQDDDYQRWARRDKMDQENESGSFDPFSVATGRQPKRRPGRGVYRKGKKYHDKPIWEEEGNFISLLLGRTKRGAPLSFQNVLDGREDSLVSMFGTITKSLLVLGSYMCRWASVRGAIPQPVVVLGVATAGICGRKPVRAIVVALILMRTFGELLHGALNGDEGWEEEEKEVNDNEEEEEGLSGAGSSGRR
jgi:hypothetical protein